MATAIIILGGGIDSKDNLLEAPRLRYEQALSIHQKYDYIICSSRWTYRLEGRGHRITEAEAGKRYLLARGVPAAKILKEEVSRDTFSNAYYCRKLLIDPLKIKKMVVITSLFHMPKSKFVFRVVFPSNRYDLKFIASPNGGVDKTELANRIVHEKNVIHFYKKHLFTTYKIKVGDMKSIGRFMRLWNPATSGRPSDNNFRELGKKMERTIPSKKGRLY